MWGGEGDEKKPLVVHRNTLAKMLPRQKTEIWIFSCELCHMHLHPKFIPLMPVPFLCTSIPSLQNLSSELVRILTHKNAMIYYSIKSVLIHQSSPQNKLHNQNPRKFWKKKKRKRCLCLRNYYLMGRSGWILKQFSILLLGGFFW